MLRRGLVTGCALAIAAAAMANGRIVSAQAGGTYYAELTIPLEEGASWSVGDIWHFPWSNYPDDEPGLDRADARLIFRDGAGTVLHSRLVARLEEPDNGGRREVEDARAEFPAQPAARRAQLYTIDSLGNPVDLRAERVRSANAPVVEILSPRPGQVLTDGLVIRWQASDLDGDRLLYSVLYRPSVGFVTQQPFGLATTATSMVFRRGSLPADESATIAIQANDGFNTTEATVSGLKVQGNLPPRVYIYHPHDGNVVLEGAGVILDAIAEDPEDGRLHVSWVSSLDGPIVDASDGLWTTASVGVHVLTASAIDSGGVEASARVTIRIAAVPVRKVFLPQTVRSALGDPSAALTAENK